ncbi:MFS transporter [Leeuwenhoekiella sp. A16]|uniref:MFS transporter n=1 Tax=unclassified Leeuwenhoekiella TaxID=2615029 RepID=UPI003A80B481
MKALKLIASSRRYLSPAIIFATLNIVFGTWAIYIPRITKNLNVSEGELGFAVLFIALGTLSMLPFIPRLINKYGVGKMTAVGVFAFCISFIGPFAVSGYVGLCVALFCVGACGGMLDVSMNTLVTEIEKKDGVHFMSAAHGFFSLGGMVGAGIGTFLMPVMPNALTHIIIISVIMIVVNYFLIKNYITIIAPVQEQESVFKLKNIRPLIGLGIIGVLIMASEGAIVDWSALYLEKVTLAAASLFGLGYTVFNAAMAFGRFYGDGISAKYGSKVILVTGASLAAVGFALVLTADIWTAIAGFGLVGLGFSVMVPELLRYSGNLPGVAAAEGVSFISGTGFTGMLLGPVFLGFLAETFSLKSSFIALLCFAVLAGLIALSLKRK